jgi:hypothetical protein
MFCPECGIEVGESRAFCRFCGARLASTTVESRPKQGSTPKRQGPSVLRSFVIISVLLTFAIAITISTHYDPQTSVRGSDSGPQVQPVAPDPVRSAGSPDTPSAPSERKPPQNLSPTYEIGQQFSVGYWSYICNSAYWTHWIGSGPYSMEHANADFVVVNITVRNDDTSSSTLPPFQLTDGEGRTYDESSRVMLNQGFFSLDSLNPGVSKRGSIAFDVPPDRPYSLIISGGIESGKQAIVILPTPEPSSNQPSPPSSVTSQ